ncbi:Rieske 2Fe-2S domain-containing protein [Saccharopolyspora phatthalungensis]|uniref:Nitrite reductase/ring-hydroxylating ferredoxin subunit n=1 Tax=Saccharopolyspora phatthalungensis TaxID=664693 RepID=A0A840QAD3_9PSEU|nr:Rieske 2Fe-2S domain-containing protein [Saccharopolyspora phatthalungensis]MBB5155618.1 nitrite reductase/ring-hydroxylating ferredoxin subunit [Saccharopolyspora phatthalungensis]
MTREQQETQVERGQRTALPLSPNGLNLAASWYVALASHELRRKPKPLTLFGLPLVAWRDQVGNPVIMPRFCPHMGASLALGEVVDGMLRCPFHKWGFDASGSCASIPGVDKIPPTARLSPYPVNERYGHIWVWYGSAEPMFPLPDFRALEDDRDAYVGFRFNDRTDGTVRQLLENGIDYFHFMALHGMNMDPVRFKLLHDPVDAADNGRPISREAWFGVWLEGSLKIWKPWQNPTGWVHNVVTTFNEGTTFQLLVDGWPGGQRFTTYIDGQEMSKVLMGTTPTAPYRTAQRGWAGVRKTNKHWKTFLRLLLFYAQNRGGTRQDIPIYNTSATGRPATYIKYDSALIKWRRYYQSWVDHAQPARQRAGECT